MRTRTMVKGLLLGIILFWVMLPRVGHTVPTTINYQGYLTDAGGTPINATVQMVFSLYNDPVRGTALWTETQNSVVVAAGIFSVNLGSVNPINPVTLPFDVPYYLGVKVGADAEMTPRIALATVPYAFRAMAADNAGEGTITGVTASTGLTGGGTSGTVTLSILPAYLLPQSCGTGQIPSWSGSAWVCAADQNTGGTITGVTAGSGLTGGGTSGNVTLSASFGGGGAATTVSRSDHGHSAAEITSGTLDNARFSAYSDLSAEGYLGNAKDSDLLTRIQADGRYINEGQLNSISSSMIGVPLSLSGSVSGDGVISGTNSSGTGYGFYGIATATGAVTNYGGIFEANGNGGRGVAGYANAAGAVTNYGGYFGASGNAGYGVYGHASATGAVANYGGYFGASGNAGYGVYGHSTGTAGYGVYGDATATGEGVANIGGFFNANGDLAYGVYGNATATGAFESNSGGYFRSWGRNGFGVVGEALGSYGIGVYGKGGILAAGFVGDVSVVGTLSKTAGSFRIDHPLDPENKYLYHSFVESPDMKNIYDGVAVLDPGGEAWVELPEWFEALNKDFRYQLTCIGGFAQVYIAEKVSGNRFKIAGGISGLEVSWQVTGVRKDAYAEAHRIPVEEMKKPGEQGYYIHPDLYGHPEEKSMEWARRPEMMKKMKEERERVKEIHGK